MSELNYDMAICIPRNGQLHYAQENERIRIQWQSIEGYPMDSDNCKVVRILNDYVMLVRIGWIGNTPQLMAFPRHITEYENGIPIVREWNGIAWNYVGMQTPVIPAPPEFDIYSE